MFGVRSAGEYATAPRVNTEVNPGRSASIAKTPIGLSQRIGALQLVAKRRFAG